ncbi:hypothetical protein K431DRAFT_349131 [Polychaeton citri CBS 116435]|uniref:WW domain-containing protein n=1 Tax=Polychaeton citri CBS 116435 TaxID=1314669 RepID=A0A9P4Q1V2_9PEZI|nr:hypothetical protein K431DRAFT_349131 [Polychaeton citri CBS 116435]
MADFAPPTGPPPPKVPDGWKAIWNDQYKEWFYVNTVTKQSQWDKPTEPANVAGGAPPPGAPPGYDHGQSHDTGPEKGGFGSNNPYASSNFGGSGSNTTSDEEYARRLQEEENARAAGNSSRGASDGYYGSGAGPQSAGYGQQQPQQSYASQDLPPREQKRGLFGKLSSKLGGGGSSSRPSGYGQQQQQQYGGYPPQQQYGGYPPQQQYGGYPPQQQYGGGYPPQGGYYQQAPQKRHGGMGAGGAAALGVGGGLLGGVLLADAMNDNDQDAYEDGTLVHTHTDDFTDTKMALMTVVATTSKTVLMTDLRLRQS